MRLDPSSGSFSECSLGHQCILSCNEGPITEHTIQGEASPEVSTDWRSPTLLANTSEFICGSQLVLTGYDNSFCSIFPCFVFVSMNDVRFCQSHLTLSYLSRSLLTNDCYLVSFSHSILLQQQNSSFPFPSKFRPFPYSFFSYWDIFLPSNTFTISCTLHITTFTLFTSARA